MLPYAINFSEPQIRNLSKEKQLNSCVTKQCYVTHLLYTLYIPDKLQEVFNS